MLEMGMRVKQIKQGGQDVGGGKMRIKIKSGRLTKRGNELLLVYGDYCQM